MTVFHLPVWKVNHAKNEKLWKKSTISYLTNRGFLCKNTYLLKCKTFYLDV